MSQVSVPRRAARVAKRPDLEVVKGSRRRLGVTSAVLSVVALLVLFGLVGFQALIVVQQSRIDDLDAQIQEETRRNQQLRLDVAELESPERIRAAALAMVGMVEPEEVIYLESVPADQLVPVTAASSETDTSPADGDS